MAASLLPCLQDVIYLFYVLSFLSVGVIVAGVFVLRQKSSKKISRSQTNKGDAPRPDKPARVFLWAVPRSVSTTLLISLSQSPNIEAWYEPYFFSSMVQSFLSSGSPITLRRRVIMLMAKLIVSTGYSMKDFRYKFIKEQLENRSENRHVFVKDMVKGIAGHFEYIPSGYTHAFLIRHPLRVFHSYKRKHNVDDRGQKGLLLTEYSTVWIPKGYFFKEMRDLVNYVRDVLKSKVIIIDAEDLIEDPESVLKAYCKEVGLEFSNEMTKWIPDNNVWKGWTQPKEMFLESWYNSIYVGYNPTHMTSFSKSGFGKKTDLPVEVDDDVRELAEASMGYYQELYEQRLQY